MPVIKEFSIAKEYEKHPEILPEDISKLREWLVTQPHLPGQYITDLDLLLAFYCCECSAEVTKQVLDLHYTLRTLFTGFFKDRHHDDLKVQLNLDTILYAALPTPSPEGYRAIYCRLLDPDPRKFSFPDTVRTFMMTFDLWQYEEGTWPGFIIMIDMDQAVLGHIAKLEVMTIRQMLYFLQECMLTKLKSVHFLNAPSFMDKLMMLLKPFMKKSLLDIIHIHQTGDEQLYDFVPKKAFPKEAGGEFKSYNVIREELVERFKENAEYIRDENRRRVDESRRPGGKKATVEDLFSIQGSFKKLDID